MCRVQLLLGEERPHIPMSTAQPKRRTKSAHLGDLVSLYLNEAGEYSLLTAEEERELAQQMEDGRAAEARLRDGTSADPAEDRRLVRLGEAARERFIAANLRLVVSVVRKVGRPGLDLADKIQEGNLGLIRAVEKFDWRRGVKFSTYATWWIRQAIERGVTDKGRAIRVPAHINDQISRVRATEAMMEGQLGRSPTDRELAEETGIPETVVRTVRSLAETTSLDEPVGSRKGRIPLGDLVGGVDHTDDLVDALTARALVEVGLDAVDEREREVLRLRYGLEGRRVEDLGVIADRFGVSRERIRQLELRALGKIRRRILDQVCPTELVQRQAGVSS